MYKVNGDRVHGIIFKSAHCVRFDGSYTQFKHAKSIKFRNILWRDERGKIARRTLSFFKSTITD
jgi:hypothetical protein